ncbi:hypothetical protein SBP18_17270 [Rhodoferax ferrireducens]|uniref:hypothetical protein n=1 Tax=Rhodoferax ferrireducens TaxID=192843 RepID=UPI00298E9593|nr:hypothetical protein [Rhodoferax ferrireducens]WPC66217.1 hypothetical protein SBP18_17270 [Rhodoferax ferrireducens]
MSAMMNFIVPDSLALAEQSLAGFCADDEFFERAAVDGSGLVSCHFSPTHSPNPGFWGQSPNSPSRRLAQRERRHAPQRNWCLTPITQRGELHLAASMKVGNRAHHRALASTRSQHKNEAVKLISAQRQPASKCVQPIEKPCTPFDGNVPMHTFFPPFKTRSNVAVGSPFRPGGGGEGLGERGGIQRLKNKKVAENRFEVSSGWAARVEKILQKKEHITQMRRGLEARTLQNMLAMAQLVAASRELVQ